MSDPDAASEAARALSVTRWGTAKTDRLARELAARRDLRPEHLAAIRAALGKGPVASRGALTDAASLDEGDHQWDD